MSIDLIAGFTVDSFAAVSCQSGDLLGRRCQKELRIILVPFPAGGPFRNPCDPYATSRAKRNEPGNEGITFCARNIVILDSRAFSGRKMYEEKARPSQTRLDLSISSTQTNTSHKQTHQHNNDDDEACY